MSQTQLGHVLLKPEQPWHLTEWPAMNLTWIHTTPICNPPLSSPGPAEWRLKSQVMANHLKFIARTVMVQEGNVEGAYRTLNRILTMDGLIEDIKRRRYYEKPCRRRQRESYETCRRIYNMEMARKINFLMRKNRADPWQGC
ncbi:PREDICTED: 28S ribosomal protein S21, mitochondrial isoform X3 [Propithecus coquereli]|nr:PREDICTED: 28S ribosomal protein S21, mitochondrial isoform X3 [Propithecus coquereli]